MSFGRGVLTVTCAAALVATAGAAGARTAAIDAIDAIDAVDAGTPASGVAAIGSAGTAADNVACVSRRTGEVRMRLGAGAAKACRRGWTRITWSSLGPTGPGGATGATGPAGAPGPAGSPGTTGAEGPAGPTGPSGPTGAEGTPGADGRTLLNGVGKPPVEVGSDGDFYIDTAKWTLFGPKLSGEWPAEYVSMIGPAGEPGPTGPAGPSSAVGPLGLVGQALVWSDGRVETWATTNDAAVTAIRLAAGRYQVLFPGVFADGYAFPIIHVSARTSSAYPRCGPEGAFGAGGTTYTAMVACFDATGAFVDGSFYITVSA